MRTTCITRARASKPAMSSSANAAPERMAAAPMSSVKLSRLDRFILNEPIEDRQAGSGDSIRTDQAVFNCEAQYMQQFSAQYAHPHRAACIAGDCESLIQCVFGERKTEGAIRRAQPDGA